MIEPAKVKILIDKALDLLDDSCDPLGIDCKECKFSEICELLCDLAHELENYIKEMDNAGNS